MNEVSGIDRLVHEPARLSIMAVLANVDRADFLFLLNNTGLTRGNLSSHSAKLEAAGYIEIDKTFVGKIPRTLYRLTGTGLEALAVYRGRLESVLHRLPGGPAAGR